MAVALPPAIGHHLVGRRAAVAPWGACGTLVRFEEGGVPLVLAVRAWARAPGAPTWAALALRVTVPTTLSLEVRARPWLPGRDPVRGREVMTGDEAFDARFRVQGDPSLARAVLGRELRDTLRALADADPSLVVQGGIAHLAWIERLREGEAPVPKGAATAMASLAARASREAAS